MNKTFPAILIAFASGFFINRLISNRMVLDQEKVLPNEKCTDLVDAKTNLISLSQNEYLEYTKIKDLKLKYEKADELLGKVMLLFLADVGFRLQHNTPPEYVVTKSEVLPLQVSTESVIKPETEAVNHTLSDSKAAIALAGRSTQIKNLGTERQILQVLDEAIIENPKMEAAKGVSLSSRQARIIEGRYMGTVKFLDGKREKLSVIWDLAPDYSKNNLSGTFNLSIHGPGQNSESNGRGDIDNIVSLAEDREGFLVNGCGDRCYLQLYYNSRADQFYGNYYELLKGSQSKSARLGIVELRK